MNKATDHGDSGLTLGQLVMVRTPHGAPRKGHVVGFGQKNKNPRCVRVKRATSNTVETIHQKFIHPDDPDLST